MVINRDHFRRHFSAFPDWRCSTCGTGSLVEAKDTRIDIEPAWSKDAHGEDWWEPEMITRRLVAVLRCQNPKCGEAVFVTGNVTVNEAYDDEFGPHYYDQLEPMSALPPMAVFPLEERWPESVTNQLKLAFSHVLRDAGAAGNRLRTAVECLLDHLNIKKYPRTGPRRQINLHARILDFRQQNPEAADLLLAVKWLGNTGSHSDVSGLTREDVLDAMELLERALHLVYDDTSKRLTRLAKQINRKRGPARKKTR